MRSELTTMMGNENKHNWIIGLRFNERSKDIVSRLLQGTTDYCSEHYLLQQMEQHLLIGIIDKIRNESSEYLI